MTLWWLSGRGNFPGAAFSPTNCWREVERAQWEGLNPRPPTPPHWTLAGEVTPWVGLELSEHAVGDTTVSPSPPPPWLPVAAVTSAFGRARGPGHQMGELGGGDVGETQWEAEEGVWGLMRLVPVPELPFTVCGPWTRRGTYVSEVGQGSTAALATKRLSQGSAQECP